MERPTPGPETRPPPRSVMIPEKIARFLEQRANVAFAGTRNRDLVPLGHRVSGWRMGADGRTLTAFLPEPFTAGLVESLQENGELALTVEDFPAHETYQFKGRYVRHRPVQREDIAIVDRIRERFMKSMRAVFPDGARTHPGSIHLEARACRRVRGVCDLRADTRARRWCAYHAAGGGVTRPMTRLPDEIRPVLDNGIPAVMVTCSSDGIPNVTVISQVYYVDDTHAALSFQFFSKTIRNVRENPRAYVRVWDMIGHTSWVLQLEFQHSETEGPVFDAMDMQIEAIASTTGMSGIFKLRAADIYRVVSVERVPYAEWTAS